MSRSIALRSLICALSSAVLAAGSAAAQHGGDVLVGSTTNGGGALRAVYDFTAPIRVTKSFGAGGTSLYSSTDPGLDALLDAAAGAFPLKRGVEVRVEVIRVDAGASVQLSGVTLDATGESAPVGTAPNLHNHPAWRLTLPDGVVGSYQIVFRLTASRSYEHSEAYVVTLTNDASSGEPSATPTATPTATIVAATATATVTPSEIPPPPPTATATVDGAATPSPAASGTPAHTATASPSCVGDCDGNGIVTVSELVRGVNQALGGEGDCTAFDADGDGAVRIGELIAAVTLALAGCPR